MELQRDLEEKAASAPEGIDKLLEQLGDAKNELSEANAQIKALTAERDALQEQVAQLSAEADRLRAAAENGNNLLGILNSTRENENSVSLSERQHQSEPVSSFYQ